MGQLRPMTADQLKSRGYCCGLKCRNCPYYPKHRKGNTNLGK